MSVTRVQLVGNVSTGASFAGIVTATSFSGSGANLTGIAATDNVRTNSLVVSGVSTLSNVVVGGATTQLIVTGDARVTGILTVGSSSITLNGTTNTINVGTGLTLSSSGINVVGVITATSFSGNGSGLTGAGIGTTGSINTSGIITASSFSGDGSGLTGVGLGTTGSINTSGIITASSFSGNGSGLTGVAATTLTIGAGTTALPSISPTGDSNTGIFFPSADTIAFAEGGTEALRVDSSGRLLVGTSTARTPATYSSPRIQIEATSYTSAALSIINNESNNNEAGFVIGKSRGTSVNGVTSVNSGDTLGQISFQGADGTNLLNAATIKAEVDGTPGANDMPGRLVFSTTADGSASQTERMRISSTGVTNFGSSLAGGSGKAIIYPTNAGSGVLVIETGGFTCAIMDRQLNDGTLISFKQESAEEGSISVSGTTVSYNGAHLSRWSQLASGAERIEILRGSVLSNLDEMCEWIDAPKEAVLWQEGDELPEGVSVGDIKEPAVESGLQENEQLNRMKVSEVEGDKNVSGVFQCWDDDDDTYINDFYCAMTGDFIIRIADGVTVERGDLLMSAGDGTAKPQDDDIIRSKTVAKVTSTNVTCTYEDGSYCVPCVLMAC